MNVFRCIYCVCTYATILHSAFVSKAIDCSVKQPNINVPLKPWDQSTNSHCTTSQTPVIFVFTAVIT